MLGAFSGTALEAGVGGMEEKVRDAILEELQRQAETQGELVIQVLEDGVDMNGHVDLDALVMAVIGSFAGGP